MKTTSTRHHSQWLVLCAACNRARYAIGAAVVLLLTPAKFYPVTMNRGLR